MQRRQEEGGACRHEDRERGKLGESERGDEREGTRERRTRHFRVMSGLHAPGGTPGLRSDLVPRDLGLLDENFKERPCPKHPCSNIVVSLNYVGTFEHSGTAASEGCLWVSLQECSLRVVQASLLRESSSSELLRKSSL